MIPPVAILTVVPETYCSRRAQMPSQNHVPKAVPEPYGFGTVQQVHSLSAVWKKSEAAD